MIPRRSLSRRRGAAVIGVMAFVVLLTGCRTIGGLIETERALARAGFPDADLSLSSDNDFDEVVLTLPPPSVEHTAEGDADRAAAVVWSKFPLRFDSLVVRTGGFERSYGYGGLVETFGARPAHLDRRTITGELLAAGVKVLIVVLVSGLVVVGVVVAVVILVVRSTRRRPPPGPPPWPAPPPPVST